MYTTSQIAQQVLVTASDWNVSGERGVLPVINEINRMMMGANIDHAVRISAATGRYPTLDTQDSVMQYDCPDDCRKVADVLVQANEQYNAYNARFDYQRTQVWGLNFYSIRNITSRLKSLSANATVTFPDNPGDTTGYYYLKYWIEPTNIQSINQQVDVPPDWHWMLVDGVVARIQPKQYGKPDPFIAWREQMKMEFWGEMNANYPRPILKARRYC